MRINKKNLEKDKSLSFLLIFWDKENVFFFAYIMGRREYKAKENINKCLTLVKKFKEESLS